MTTEKGEWKPMGPMRINYTMAGPAPVYVIKRRDGKYLRALTIRGCAWGPRDMATRFDSRLWAIAVMAAFAGESRPVRLVKKGPATTGEKT